MRVCVVCAAVPHSVLSQAVCFAVILLLSLFCLLFSPLSLSLTLTVLAESGSGLR